MCGMVVGTGDVYRRGRYRARGKICDSRYLLTRIIRKFATPVAPIITNFDGCVLNETSMASTPGEHRREGWYEKTKRRS